LVPKGTKGLKRAGDKSYAVLAIRLIWVLIRWQLEHTISHLAISSSITNLPLIVDTRNPANNRIEKSLKEIDSRGLVETVETITIDEFCNSKKITPNLIKIDVQGHEMDCLRGAIRTINSKELQILMIEMDFDNFPDSCANIFTFLRSLEFKAFTMVNKKLAEIKSSNSMSGYHDFFYLKGISLEKLR